MKLARTLFCAAALALSAPSLSAAQDASAPATSRQASPESEKQARNVGRQLRCVVCQNQNIEESDAPLAADMRRMVRDLLEQGNSEAEIIETMRQRYGDFVLLKPPLQANTLILWGAPIGLMLVILLWWVMGARKPRLTGANVSAGLTDADEARLRALRDKMEAS